MRLIALLVAVVLAFAVWAHVHDAQLAEEVCGQSQVTLSTEQRGVQFWSEVGRVIAKAKASPEGVDERSLAQNMLAVWRILHRWWGALTATAKGEKVTIGPGITCEPCPPRQDPKTLVSLSLSSRQGFTSEQRSIAASAVKVADDMGIPRRGKVVILTAGFVESGVRNLTYGDRDSVGWLQQRAGWGSRAERMNPAYASRKFFQALQRVSGWQSLPVGTAAQAVQISAFPGRYAGRVGDAERLLASVGELPAPAPQAPSGDCTTAPVVKVDAGRYNLGPVKDHVRAAAGELGPRFGIRVIGGVRPDPLPDHPSGLALDFMCSRSQGDRLATYARANASRLGVAYIIWNRKIWSVRRNGEGWRDYYGTSNPHTDHVHITFISQGVQT